MGEPQVDSAWSNDANDNESDSEELEQIKQQIQEIQKNAFRQQINAMTHRPPHEEASFSDDDPSFGQIQSP